MNKVKNNYEAVYHDEEPDERLAEWSVVHWDTINGTSKMGHSVKKFGAWEEKEAQSLADALNKNPIWITVDGGDVFAGHQGHWADCFFSNATESAIRDALETNSLFPDETCTFEIREMTDEEVAAYPEIIEFREILLKRYGEF